MNAPTSSSIIEEVNISILSNGKNETASELTKYDNPQIAHDISGGICRVFTSTNTASASDNSKISSNSRYFRSYRRVTPFISTTTQEGGQSSFKINESSKHDQSHVNKRKRAQDRTAIADTISSSRNIDKSVVSDDDDSVSNLTAIPNTSKKRKRIKATAKNIIAAPTPMKHIPFKLNTSQIHSKKYPFPHKLFDLLNNASMDDRSSKVVSWSTDGMSFTAHNHARLAAEILPTYFGHTQLRSFDRQLNYWGFELISPRIINNTSIGGKAWKHPFFKKGRRDLLQQVTRKIIRGSSQSSSKKKKKKSRSTATTVNKTVDSLIKNASLRIKESLKSESMAPDLPPRMVSPVYGVSSAASRSQSSSQDMIVSAVDIVVWDDDSQKNNIANKDHSTESVFIEDAFQPIFPLESFKDDAHYVQEKDIPESVFVELFADTKAVPRDNENTESYPKFDVFEGNSFHHIEISNDMGIDIDMDMDMDMDMNLDLNVDVCVDVDMNMTMDMNMNVDEAELFLNIIENKDGENCDDYLLSSHGNSETDDDDDALE